MQRTSVNRARCPVTRAGFRPASSHGSRHKFRRHTGLRRSCQAQASAGNDLIPDENFSIAKVSFGDILAPVGVGLMVFGFGAYFSLIPGSDISGVALIYGFPILLLGFALKYAQLDPVPCTTTRSAFELRDSQMTDNQKRVRDDCTRYRYGDEQHLEEALERVFMIGRPTGIPRRQCPRLEGLREEVTDGNYTLVMEFLNRNNLSEEQWLERENKFASFFGPGISATVNLLSDGKAEVALRSDGSGEGMDGQDGSDVLPPLAPGQKPRVQNSRS
eukprot:jgi/Ulvmu1/7223/UM035_0009.1